MSQEIRTLTPDDAHAHDLLMAQAFSKGNVVTPPAPDAPPREMTGTYGMFENGRLRASVSVEDFDVHWPGSREGTLAMGGVAGVATFADARGRGFVDQLLRHSLNQMRERGQTISSLYPFAWAFYRRHGWAWVGEKHDVRIPLPELKATPEGREVVQVEAAAGADPRARADGLKAGYTRFAQAYRGMFTSESHKWGDKLNNHGGRTTYVFQHPPTGAYLLWRYNSDNSEGQITEFIAPSAEGYRALLGQLHYLTTQCDKARVTLPADHLLWSHLYHWGMETRTEPVFMGRIVDICAALAHLTPAPNSTGSFTLGVEDGQAPWNQGTFRITYAAGQVECAPRLGEGADADVSLTIQTLSQAFWGTPGLEHLRRADQVCVTSEDGYRQLMHLLPPAPVYTRDDF